MAKRNNNSSKLYQCHGGVECVERKVRFAITEYKNKYKPFGGDEMREKKPSEEVDKEDFFRRFDFVNGYGAMEEFIDK